METILKHLIQPRDTVLFAMAETQEDTIPESLHDRQVEESDP